MFGFFEVPCVIFCHATNCTFLFRHLKNAAVRYMFIKLKLVVSGVVQVQ